MTGWGKTSANAGNVPNTLQTTTVNLLNNADCQNRLGIRIYPGQLCTYNRKGVGICMVRTKFQFYVLQINMITYHR